jgi:DNA-binding MarR family transcriptional regulator
MKEQLALLRAQARAAQRAQQVTTTADTPPSAPVESEADILRLIATYERLIETKDLAGLRAISPSTTSAQFDDLQTDVRRWALPGYRLEDLQDVAVQIKLLTYRYEGRTAEALIRRDDTFVIDGRRRVLTYGQVLRFEKTDAGSWSLTAVRLGPLDTPLPDASNEATAILSLITAYERLIETKDLAGLRAISPSTTSAQFDALQTDLRRWELPQLRLEDLQGIAIKLLLYRFEGRTAEALIRRDDTFVIDGRRSVLTYGQILRFEKADAGSWSLTAVRYGDVPPAVEIQRRLG